MPILAPASGPVKDPIVELLSRPEDAVLAVIIGVEGPSYRPVGAAMTVFADRHRAGSLSSGCVEADITTHALDVLEAGRPEVLRYGRGSPFLDIQLPCGGGLEILLVPRPDRGVLRDLADRRAARQPCTLEVDIASGSMTLLETGDTGRDGAVFRVRHEPDIRFLVFGKGPEASTFAALVQSAGYPNLLLSPDGETLQEAEKLGCGTRHLVRAMLPEDVAVDPWTAIILFFHDHDWEPPILQAALDTTAFYIGAQGSQRARDARLLMLEGMGVPQDARARLYGPVGLIPSSRDAGTLAVSVLAEILAVAGEARA
ncbi:xanthine dehydrogenase accessory factor [Aliiruegeria haliotis]|uniref:Xanthine dehydrogenase accessory factor n=1 Tax=Aliiruegeria haliotis TaxID=1280846 RepID=A0A2T0RRQ4_9RHOB|nr:XdhC family protein [Aliiruegeria haliotis]PRY23864.1 xanthine dehydrogenase accessory factor [Aliiruegeria haliotis]